MITIKGIDDLQRRDNSLLDVYQIWFNWSPDSHVITIKGHDEKETPEYDGIERRSNSVAHEKVTYTIKPKTKDASGVESNWCTFEVTMPRNITLLTTLPIFQCLFERFPILRHLLGL